MIIYKYNISGFFPWFSLLICLFPWFGPYLGIDASSILDCDYIKQSWFAILVPVAYKFKIVPIFLSLIIWLGLCRFNKDKIFNSVGNCYYLHWYITYWLANFFGIKQCRLMRVPIPMQFKLITRGTFETFIYQEGTHPLKIEFIDVQHFKAEPDTSTINLVLSDTYGISYNQLPTSVKQFTTIKISRMPQDGVRYYSEAFVKETLKVLHELPSHVQCINLFATTNPHNTYCIATEGFCQGNRGNIRHLTVFQQESKFPRNFNQKGEKIY